MILLLPLLALTNYTSTETATPTTVKTSSVEKLNSRETYLELMVLLARSSYRNIELSAEQSKRLEFMQLEKNRIWREAEQLIQTQKYNLAVAKYKEMLKYQPGYTQVYLAMGDVRYAEGNANAAADFYQQGRDHINDVPNGVGRFLEPLARLGDLAAAKSNYVEAVGMYRQLVYSNESHDWILPDGKSVKNSIFPLDTKIVSGSLSTDNATLARCALYLFRAGAKEEALHMYQIALKYHHDSEKSNSLRDNSTKGLMKDLTPKGAKVTAWSEILDQNMPADALDQNRFESACYTMMALTIGNSSWIDDSGRLWKEDKEAAVVAAQKAVSLSPNYAPAHLVLGLAYEKCGQKDKAKAAFKEASSFDVPGVRELVETLSNRRQQ